MSDSRIVPAGLPLTGLDGVIKTLFEVSWGKARDWIATGKVRVDGRVAMDERMRPKVGATIEVDLRARRARVDRDLPRDAIVFVDTHLVVVNKPAGISTVPYDDTEEGTLDVRVRAYLEAQAGARRSGPAPLGVVHRIDKETTGLVAFTRTWLAKQHVAQQFRAHTVHRLYHAIVHGRLRAATYRSHLVENRGDGLRGSAKPGHKEGRLAVTHVEPIESLDDATLVACRLETGRTHQIRIHLSEAGHPLVGERVYIRHYKGHEIPAPRLMLHAAELGLVHPKTGQEMRWSCQAPRDFEETLARLRPAPTEGRPNVAASRKQR